MENIYTKIDTKALNLSYDLQDFKIDNTKLILLINQEEFDNLGKSKYNNCIITNTYIKLLNGIELLYFIVPIEELNVVSNTRNYEKENI